MDNETKNVKPIPEHYKLDLSKFDVLLYDASGSSVDNDRFEAEKFDYCGVLDFLTEHQEITICTHASNWLNVFLVPFFSKQ